MPEPFILFEVAGATYAVPSEQVQLVEMVQNITRVPNAPDFVEGVIAVRGQVIPLVSMRRRFRMDPRPLDLRTRVIVTRLEDRQIGLLVDTAREFVSIDLSQIEPAPETLQGPLVPYLDGVVNIANRLILIIHLSRLFSSPEQAELAGEPANSPPTEDPSRSV